VKTAYFQISVFGPCVRVACGLVTGS